MPWYYASEGQQRGPVSDDEFNGLVRSGVVRADTLVWQQGWPDWRAYCAAAGGVAAGDAADPDTAVCAVSGQRRPKSEMLEFEGRWVSVERKEEFFQRLREGVNLPREFVYASFGRRFGAKIIDGLIVGVITFGCNAVLGALMIGSAMGVQGNPDAAAGMIIGFQILSQLVSLGLGLGYSLYFIRKNDATPGKKALGLRLVRADGSKLSKGRIVGRHFAEWVSGMILLIGYLMAAFDKEQRRALHDRMCDTRVIDVRGL